jgi:Na+/melibiose symporter-like transporter
VKQDILDLINNRPWLIILSVTILIFITLALKGGMTIYYFENFLSAQHVGMFLESTGFNNFIASLNSLLVSVGLNEFLWPKDAATSGFSLFNACGILFMIVGIFISKPLADKYGKRDVFTAALSISAFTLVLFYFYSSTSISAVFITQIIHGFFYGVTIPLLWAMIADVADYSEWKNNRRATAIIFSAMIFGLKVGLSVGGSLVALILAYYGYNSELNVQADETTQGIKFSISVLAALPFIISIIALLAYEINKTLEHVIESELLQRRAS